MPSRAACSKIKITANTLSDEQIFYELANLFSPIFQLMTDQIAPKYSALRFWY